MTDITGAERFCDRELIARHVRTGTKTDFERALIRDITGDPIGNDLYHGLPVGT